MDFLFSADIVKPAGMANEEFLKLWHEEATAATAALDAGGIKALYKVAGEYKVIGIFDFPDADSVDAAVHSLPFWASGHHEIVQNITMIPLRDYRNWFEDLKKMI